MAHAYAKSRCGIKHKIQVSKLDPETLEVIDDGPVVFDGTLTQPTAEGPKMYKRNGWYYIFIPAGGVEFGWQTVLRSRNVFGPYEDRIVMHQGNADINGPHQGAWVDDPQGNDWFLHFQDRFELGRVVHLQPMCWHNDWPFIGLEQNGDGIGEPVNEWDCPAGEAVDGLAVSDTFPGGVPGLQWQWQANPQPDQWLRKGADGLHLACGSEKTTWRMPNMLSQMLPAADFTAKVKLSLANAGAGAKTGVVIEGHTYSAIELERSENGCTLRVLRGDVKETVVRGQAVPVSGALSEAEEVTVAEKSIDTAEITVTMKVTDAKQVQYGCLLGGETVPLGEPQPITRATWTGARLGVYARGGAAADTADIAAFTVKF